MFRCKPSSKKIANIDPVQRLYMFEQWLADQNDKYELAKNHAYLIGSFTNPQMVQDMLGTGPGKYTTTDEEFEKSWAMVQEDKIEEEKIPRRKRKRLKSK